MKRKLLLILTAAVLALFPNSNFGQAPALGAASSFALFTSAGAFNVLGASTSVTGDVGTNAGLFTGFPPGALNGNIYLPGSAVALQAATDLGLAYAYLSTLGGTVLPSATLGNGQVLTPGTYFRGEACTLNGTLTLSGGPSDIFIIRIGGALATGTFTNILLSGGATLDNVYWQVMGAFNLGDYSIFRGNVIAGGAIHLLEGSTLLGRGLTTVDAIALHNNSVILGVPPTAPSVTLTQPTCTVATGTITVTAPTGTGMTYSINGSTYTNTTGIFTPVTPGPYTATAMNSLGLISPGTLVTILAQPATPPAPSVTLTQPTCVLATGTITVTAPTETGMTYSIDGITYSNTTGIFSSLNPGPYTVTAKSFAGCISPGTTVTILAQPATPPVPSVTLIQPSCILATGTITVTAPTGAGMTYSIDGITYTNTTGIFDMLSQGPYNVTAKNSTGCISPATSVTILTAPPAPVVFAGNDATICQTSTYTLSESLVTNAVSVLWTTSGTGSFNDPTILHPVYTPGAADIQHGSVLLTLILTPTAPCVVVSDPLVLIINPQAVVNAGSDASTWTGSPFTVSSATSQFASSILWIHNGTGTLTNATTLTPTYTPGLGESGPVTLTVTAGSAGPCVNATDQMILTVNPGSRQGILTTKSALETSFSAVGNVVHYVIDVFNNSSESIYNISVTDPNAVITSGNPIALLVAGVHATVLANHTITQLDIDAGQVINCASVSGTYSDGSPTASSSSCVTVMGMPRPQITITKFAAETTFHSVGDIIHYSFEIFNCGSVTVSNIIVSDPKAIILTGSPISSLAPRTTVTATGQYVVTQTDVDAGKISNIAFVAGIDPTGRPVRDDSNEITIYSNQPAQLVVAKFASETSFSAKGDTIHYEIWVKNFRTTTMSNIVVSDLNATFSSSNSIFRMVSGTTNILYAFHVVTQSDLDAGKVINVATARGTDYYDVIDRATSNEVTVFAIQSPGLIVTKTADESSYSKIGDLIHYTHEIKNTGNIKITGIILTDPNTSRVGSNKIASLKSGESAVIRTVYTISQLDLNLGSVGKTASISGYDANLQPIMVSSNPIVIKGIQTTQFITSLTAAESSYNMEGESIHYRIELRNTGNVTITNLMVSDATGGWTIGNSMPAMVPGSISVLTAEYRITQSDLSAGKITNLVTVTGYNSIGEKISNSSNKLTITANKSEGLAVIKIAQESSYANVGDIIHYSISIKNNGKNTVSNIELAVQDSKIIGNPMISSLPPAGFISIAARHMVTQSDLDANLINNTASIKGVYPDGTAFSELSNPFTVYAIQDMQLKTSISVSETSFAAVGQEINYTIMIRNSGNVTLTGIELSSESDFTFNSSPVITLAPGKTGQVSAIYTVTVADLDAGKIVKSVNATGKAPDLQLISAASSEVMVVGLQQPELSTVASALETSFSKVGDVIHYDISVKNTGNVSIISTAVTDPNAVIITARPNTILLTGESFMATASHIITQADLDAGMVVTEAKAVGFDLNGNTIENTAKKVTVYGIANAVTVPLVIETYNLSNFPNPFSYQTTIVFDLPENGEALLKVYDMTGREIGQIDQKNFVEGRNYVIWKSNTTQKGLYFLRMTYKGNQANRIMSIVN